jgi:hypothetical protein
MTIYSAPVSHPIGRGSRRLVLSSSSF